MWHAQLRQRYLFRMILSPGGAGFGPTARQGHNVPRQHTSKETWYALITQPLDCCTHAGRFPFVVSQGGGQEEPEAPAAPSGEGIPEGYRALTGEGAIAKYLAGLPK